MEEKKTNWGRIALAVLSIAFAVFVLGQVLRIDRTVKDFLSDPFGLGVRAIDTVNIGTTANDGTGDPLRTAFIKVNAALYMIDSLGIDALSADDFTNLANLLDSLAAIRGDISSVAGFNVDSISQLATDYYAVYVGADTLPPHVPDAYTDDPYDIFPEIHAFAGDTSNYAIPDKIGNLFINTSTSKVYVSVSTSRGGWVILN